MQTHPHTRAIIAQETRRLRTRYQKLLRKLPEHSLTPSEALALFDQAATGKGAQ